MLIAAEKIAKSYSEKVLIKESTFYLNEGDKVGVIGINGAGKSTLLKIMAQAETPDGGTVTMHTGVRVGYLPQNPVLNENATVLEQVLGGLTPAESELQEYEAKTILNKLGIFNFDEKVGNLSGGQKKRVAMACVLITPCEVLILDEPTNHLDNDMTAWLESYLIKFTGAILMVTHDRYFLDRVVSKIVEVASGNLYVYDANYSKYVELKAGREEMEAGTKRKRKSLLRKELEWISRGARARGTKSRSRIQRFEELSQESDSAVSSKLDLSSVSTRLGKKTVEINGISKSYEGKLLIRDFTHIVARDARIGIVGKNGCGKSTLLNIISGRILPDTGSVVLGDTVKLGYFSQECDDMDMSVRVIDYIKSFGEYIETVDGSLSASQMLEKFLFPPDLQYNTIGRLSGGERRRLYLLSIVMGAPNVFLLDEPTNDLDIETLIILEEYLENFNGAVIMVSHDRYFLDKSAEWIFAFQDDGTILKFPGGYSDYRNEQAETFEKQQVKEIKKAAPKKQTTPSAPRRLKFTFNEQRDFDEIEGIIASLEQKLTEIAKDIKQESSNYEKLQQLMALQAELEETLNEKMERWIYLNDLADKIAAQDK